MRVFVTGATGFIGSAVVRELVDAGHEVVGLARSTESGKAVSKMGATPVIGSIEDVECLRRGAADANAAVHLAFFHQLSHMKPATRLRVLLGGSPGGISARFGQAALDAETRAIETIGANLTGLDRALVSVMPTMALTPGRAAHEDQAPDPRAAGGSRGPSEKVALGLVTKGVRASVVRLAPVVHDGNKQGLVSMIELVAKKKGMAAYVGDGNNRWSGVHVLDAARLFRLAIERGVGGARYHAVAEEGVPVRQIMDALGKRLNVPAVSKSVQEAGKLYGWLAPFVQADNPVSSALTQERLGWRPAQQGMLADVLRR